MKTGSSRYYLVFYVRDDSETSRLGYLASRHPPGTPQLRQALEYWLNLTCPHINPTHCQAIPCDTPPIFETEE